MMDVQCKKGRGGRIIKCVFWVSLCFGSFSVFKDRGSERERKEEERDSEGEKVGGKEKQKKRHIVAETKGDREKQRGKDRGGQG